MFEWLSQALKESTLVADSLGVRFDAILSPPASQRELVICESKLGEPLSPSHRTFLALHNGSSLTLTLPRTKGGPPLDPYEVVILSAEDIASRSQQIKAWFLEDTPSKVTPRLYAVARYGSSGDYCLADLARHVNCEAPIIDAFHETPRSWSSSSIIANSFEQWMQKLLTQFYDRHAMFYYWMPQCETIQELVDVWRDGRIRK